MSWVDYGGQSTEGFDFIGTDDLKFPLEEDSDIPTLVSELRRRCGQNANIRLYKSVASEDGR